MSVFGIGPAELIFVFVLAMIFIGPGKMPEVAASLGKAMREFQKASAELTEALSAEVAAVQAAKEAASNGNQVADISDAAVVAAPASEAVETSLYDSVTIVPVDSASTAPAEAELPAAVVAEDATVVAEAVASPIFPPAADPTGMAQLPASLLDPSDSMRARFEAAQTPVVQPMTEVATTSIYPPATDPTGLAPLPSALLDSSDSMRGLTVKHAAAPAASANQTEA